MNSNGSDLDPALLEILACPKCKRKLRLDEASAELLCQSCRLRYPIRDGVPVFLESVAKPLK